MRRYLLLEDGSSFEGKAFGSCDNSTGELVFNTSFTGYYEIMTDPSYGGQIIVFNFPSMFYYDYMKDVAQRNPCKICCSFSVSLDPKKTDYSFV